MAGAASSEALGSALATPTKRYTRWKAQLRFAGYKSNDELALAHLLERHGLGLARSPISLPTPASKASPYKPAVNPRGQRRSCRPLWVDRDVPDGSDSPQSIGGDDQRSSSASRRSSVIGRRRGDRCRGRAPLLDAPRHDWPLVLGLPLAVQVESARPHDVSRCYEGTAESARAWLEVAALAYLFARLRAEPA